MRRTFQLALPNGLFGDPLVVVRPRLSGRVLLLDAGDTIGLGARTLLAATDVLVSHAHVDHVFGLGRLLRVRLGRVDRALRIYGPRGLATQIRSHLGGYSWNLVDAFPLDLAVIEIDAAGTTTWRFPQADGFEPYAVAEGPPPAEAPVLVDELLAVRALALDHNGLVSIAYRLDEHRALNVDADALARTGLPPGPWLAGLKDAVRRGHDDAPFGLPGGGSATVGDLRDDLLREAPGDAVAYATDVAAEGAGALARFAAGARRLVIECHFIEADADLARRHGHLTARLAGEIARAAEAGGVSPMHISTRYAETGADVVEELRRAAAPVPVEEIAAAPLGDFE